MMHEVMYAGPRGIYLCHAIQTHYYTVKKVDQSMEMVQFKRQSLSSCCDPDLKSAGSVNKEIATSITNQNNL